MTTQEKPFDIQTYIAMALRRKWYIIIPLVLCVMGSAVYYKRQPKIYRAITLIRVQPQRIPTEYVRPTVTESVTGQLSTLKQEILSRTRLEQVIQEFDLYADLRRVAPLERIVDIMRKSIEIKVEGGTAQSTFRSLSKEENLEPLCW